MRNFWQRLRRNNNVWVWLSKHVRRQFTTELWHRWHWRDVVRKTVPECWASRSKWPVSGGDEIQNSTANVRQLLFHARRHCALHNRRLVTDMLISIALPVTSSCRMIAKIWNFWYKFGPLRKSYEIWHGKRIMFHRVKISQL